MEDGRLTGVDVPVLGVVPTADEDRIVGHLGPDLCGPELPDLDEVLERLAEAPDEPLAGALLDQRNVAGFGNVYAVELPFVVGVSPNQPVGIDRRASPACSASAPRVIRTNAARGPQNTTGRKLQVDDHWIYGRRGRPCPLCGTDARRLGRARQPVAAGQPRGARRASRSSSRAGRRPRPRPPPAGAAPGPPRADLARPIRETRPCGSCPRGATRDAAVLLETRGRPGVRRRARQRRARRLPRRASGCRDAAHRHRRHRDAARLGRADARRRAARPPPRPAPPAAARVAADDRHRARVRRVRRLLAAAASSAFVGTLNPSGGDVSVFLPTEQALLPGTAPDAQRTALFARYSLIGTLRRRGRRACAGVPGVARRPRSTSPTSTALRWTFVALRRARRRRAAPLPAPVARGRADRPTRRPSRARPVAVDRLPARRAVQPRRVRRRLRLTALLVLWLQRRFDLSLAVSGAVFFWAGVLSAFSALVAVRIAARIGLVRTMVFTHLPGERLPRSSPRSCRPRRSPSPPCSPAPPLSQMDVPARTSYVMAVVSPGRAPGRGERHQRAAQPRRRAAADRSPAGCSGTRRSAGRSSSAASLKAIYDLLLLRQFRDVRPPEELAAATRVRRFCVTAGGHRARMR